MKKRIIFLTLLLSLNFYGVSQVNPHAIGIRGGSGNFGFGGEISYQHGFGESNRLEIDLGARRNKTYGLTVLTGIYHWVWNITDGLNWYIGPGAQLGLYNGSPA